MRKLLVLAIAIAGCGNGSSATTQALCDFCLNDSQCGGNPCFQDVSGHRFCGAPCDSCPSGFSCQTVMGTAGLAQTCFPDSEACPQNGGLGHGDGGGGPNPTYDMAPMPPTTDMGGIPVGGAVGPNGGTVDRLFFGFTGDTRPAQCASQYDSQLQGVINNIFTQMNQRGVQFAVDQGDHMFSCGNYPQDAKTQLGNYVSAASLLGGKTVFMTMGNHECTGESSSLCSLSSYGNNTNYTAYMDVLKPISSKPYYRFDVMTNSGKAVFLVVADDVWDSAEQSWLTQNLTDADATAKYTFVSKHHPDGNTDHPEFQQIYDLVRQHKYTLFLTGHSHLFKRQYNDPRAMVIGCGGAPFAGGTFWGYGTALQGTDDKIYVTIYDQATGNPTDQFAVGPQ